MNAVLLMLSIALGALAGFLLGCVPGAHLTLLLVPLPLLAASLPPSLLAAALSAATGAWALAGLIPPLLLAVPDESTFLFLPAGVSAYRKGECAGALSLAAAGALVGALLAIAALAIARPLLTILLPVLRPHFSWMLWSVILFLLLSEWHHGHPFAPAGWRRALDAAGPTLTAWATFALSGVLGLLVWNRSFLPPHRSALMLTPVFAGLFSVPPLLLALFTPAPPPAQQPTPSALPVGPWLRGSLIGTAGGLAAVLLPALSGGVGAWMAHQAIPSSDRRAFLAAQGAARSVYYGGGLLLFAQAESGLIRGSIAWSLLPWIPRGGNHLGFLIAGALAVGTGIAFLLAVPAGSSLFQATSRAPRVQRLLLVLSLLGIVGITAVLTDAIGLALLGVATAIGFVPLLFRGRRIHLLGVVLLPVALALSGYTPL